MATETEAPEAPATHDIAGPWITEKNDSPVPPFLRVCYVVVASACVAYLILFMYGEVGHAERGPLVQQFNRATVTNEPLMYSIAGLAAAFFVGVSIFAARKPHD